MSRSTPILGSEFDPGTPPGVPRRTPRIGETGFGPPPGPLDTETPRPRGVVYPYRLLMVAAYFALAMGLFYFVPELVTQASVNAYLLLTPLLAGVAGVTTDTIFLVVFCALFSMMMPDLYKVGSLVVARLIRDPWIPPYLAITVLLVAALYIPFAGAHFADGALAGLIQLVSRVFGILQQNGAVSGAADARRNRRVQFERYAASRPASPRRSRSHSPRRDRRRDYYRRRNPARRQYRSDLITGFVDRLQEEARVNPLPPNLTAPPATVNSGNANLAGAV